ncbi:MAG: hypothetical protein ABI723_20735 [Bacteroidia bacterium]
MNLQSTRFIIALLYFATSAAAQKISFAPVEYKGKTLLEILKSSDNELYVVKHDWSGADGDWEYEGTLQQLDFDLKIKQEYDVKKLRKDLDIQVNKSSFVINNKLSCVQYAKYGDHSKMKYSLVNIASIDNSPAIIQTTCIDTLQPGHYTNSGLFALPSQVSNDQKYLLIGGVSNGSNPHYLLLNDKLQVIDLNIPIENDNGEDDNSVSTSMMLFGHYLVIENKALYKSQWHWDWGSEINFGNERRNKMMLSYSVIDILNPHLKKINIPSFDEIKAVSSSKIYNESTEELTIAGFTLGNSEKVRNTIMSGFYSYTVDLKTAEISDRVTMEADETVYHQFETIRKDKGDKQKISKALKMDDGSTLFVIECFTPSQTVLTGGSQMQHTTYPPIYNNIYITSFDKSGKFQWINKIERREKIKGIKPGFFSSAKFTNYGSSIIYAAKDNVHILFNDDKKVYDYNVLKDGTMTNKTLNEDDKDELVIFPQGIDLIYKALVTPKSLEQIGNNLFIPCLHNDKVTVMKITY